MFENNRNQRELIESQLSEALRQAPDADYSEPAERLLEQSDTTGYSSTELLQLAYDTVENELSGLRTELRLLREKHRLEQDRIERRIIQREALRRKILASAPKQSDNEMSC